MPLGIGSILHNVNNTLLYINNNYNSVYKMVIDAKLSIRSNKEDKNYYISKF